MSLTLPHIKPTSMKRRASLTSISVLTNFEQSNYIYVNRNDESLSLVQDKTTNIYYYMYKIECHSKEHAAEITGHTTAVQRHCNIGYVSLIDMFRINTTVYTVFENASESVQEYVQRTDYTVPEEQIYEYIAQIVLSLEPLHLNGIAHGGIVIHNVFIGRYGRIALGPSALKSTYTLTNDKLKNDIYAIGCLVYKLMTLKNIDDDDDDDDEKTNTQYSSGLNMLLKSLLNASVTVNELLKHESLYKIIKKLRQEDEMIKEVTALEHTNSCPYHDIKPNAYQRIKSMWLTRSSWLKKMKSWKITTATAATSIDTTINNNNNDDDGKLLLDISDALGWLHFKFFDRQDFRDVANSSLFLLVFAIFSLLVGIVIDLTLEVFLLFAVILALPVLIAMTKSKDKNNNINQQQHELLQKLNHLNNQLCLRQKERPTLVDMNVTVFDLYHRLYDMGTQRLQHVLNDVITIVQHQLERISGIVGYELPPNGKINMNDKVKPGTIVMDISDSLNLLYHSLFDVRTDVYEQLPAFDHNILIMSWFPLLLLICGAILGHVVAASQQIIIGVLIICVILLLTVGMRRGGESLQHYIALRITPSSSSSITTTTTATDPLSEYDIVTPVNRNTDNVYIGIQNVSGEAFAIKNITNNNDDESKYSTALEQCDSMYIVKFKEQIATSSGTTIVTEYCENGSLQDFINSHQNIDEKQALRWLVHILHGLKHVHDKDMIHGCIYPSNLLLDRWSRLKLGNFGTKDKSNQDSYTAPEPHALSKASDIYSVGCILYELLAGRSVRYDVINGYYPRKIVKNNPDVADLFRAMLSLEPTDRPNVNDILKLKWLQPIISDVNDENIILQKYIDLEAKQHITFKQRHASSLLLTNRKSWLSRLYTRIYTGGTLIEMCMEGGNILRDDLLWLQHTFIPKINIKYKHNAQRGFHLFHVIAWIPFLLALLGFVLQHMISASKQVFLLTVVLLLMPIITNTIIYKVNRSHESEVIATISAYLMTVGILRVEGRILLLQIASGWLCVPLSCVAYYCTRLLKYNGASSSIILQVTSGIASGVSVATAWKQSNAIADIMIVHISTLVIMHLSSCLLYRGIEPWLKRQLLGIQHMFIPVITLIGTCCVLLSVSSSSMNPLLFVAPTVSFVGIILNIDTMISKKSILNRSDLSRALYISWYPWTVIMGGGFLTLLSITSTLYQSYAQ